MAAVNTAQGNHRATGFTSTGKAPGTPNLGGRRITYADARAALGDPSLPRRLDDLAYVERPAIARRLRDLQWGYHAIGHALGVAGRTAHRWLVEGTRPMVPALPEAEPDDLDDDDRDDLDQPDEAERWWSHEEDDGPWADDSENDLHDDEAEPTPRPTKRSSSTKPQRSSP